MARAEALRLLRIARRDLRMARCLLDPEVEEASWGWAAQQCLEKTLKAWLDHLGSTPPSTHDISRLLLLLQAAHFIPGHCCARVGEMGRPAPIQLSAEGRIDRQRPSSGLVIEAVPEGDRQSKPFVLGQLKKVRDGCHRQQERLRTKRRHSPWRSRGWEGSRPRQQGFSLQVPPPVSPSLDAPCPRRGAGRGPADPGGGRDSDRDLHGAREMAPQALGQELAVDVPRNPHRASSSCLT